MTLNKLTIPTILVATVMVAGIFAFMPVEQASTIHTTAIALNQNTFKTATNTVAAAVGTVVTIDLDAPFKIVSISFQCTSVTNSVALETTTCDAGEDMGLATFVRDGETTAQTITVADLAGINGVSERTLFLDSDAGAIAIDLATISLVAVDNIAFTMTNDVSATAGTDDGYTLTVEVVVETAAATTFDATDIGFT